MAHPDFYNKYLASYFTSKPLYLDGPNQKKSNIRKLVEQPWQQINGELWKDLSNTLCNLSFIEAKCSVDMTDNLLVDYYEAIAKLSGEEHNKVSAFRKFIQDNANYLRSLSNCCLQLAIIESCDSPVGKEARQIATTSLFPCLEPHHTDSDSPVKCVMSLLEHTKPVAAMAVDKDKGHLVSSDGQEVIRWNIRSGAIVRRYKLPDQDDVAKDAFYKSGGYKISIAKLAASLVIGNMLVDATSGAAIRTFVNQRMINGEWMAPPAIAPDSLTFAILTRKKHKYNEAGSDHTVTVISSSSGQILAELPHTGIVNHAAFSPDSRMLVTVQSRPGYDQSEAGGEDLLIVWNISKGDRIREFKFRSNGYTTFSEDGNILFAIDSMRISSWDTTSWSELFTIYDNTEDKRGILYIDGTFVLTYGNLSVTLWNTQTQLNEGRLIFDHSRKGIYSVVLSQDHLNFMIGFGNGLIEMWSLESLRKSHTSRILSRVNDNVKVATHLIFSPDGKRIVVSYSEDQINILDVDSNTEIVSRKLFHEQENLESYKPKEYQTNKIESLQYTPDGNSIVLMLLSTKPDKESSPTPFGYKSLSFGSVRSISAADLSDQAVFEYKDFFQFESAITPDGYCIFVRFTRDKLIQLRTKDLSLIKEHNKDLRLDWVLSPDGSKLVYTNSVWSFVQNSVFYSSKESTPFFENPVFSPDGILVAINKANRVILVNISIKAEVKSLDHSYRTQMNIGNRSKNYLIFSPDGRKLLVIDAQTISIIDIHSGHHKIFEQSYPKNPEISCRFSPDSQLVFGFEKDFINVWLADSGILIVLLPFKSIDSFALSPDGTLIGVAQGGNLKFFHLLNIEKRAPFVTPSYIFQFNPRINQTELTGDCPYCGVRFGVNPTVSDIIARINSEYGIEKYHSPCLELSDKAWEEPALLSRCPNCRQEIRFNPFIAGNENNKNKWKFW
jgi:WD40 repeat protein